MEVRILTLWIAISTHIRIHRSVSTTPTNSVIIDGNINATNNGKEFIKSTLMFNSNNTTEVWKNVIYFNASPKIQLKHPNQVQKIIYQEFILRGLSQIFSGIGFVLLLALELPSSTKFFIHKNLLLTNLLSNFLFFLYHDDILYKVKEVRWLCTCFSSFCYYINTAAFTWMLNEGINICIKLFSVFDTMSGTRARILYFSIGWGLPALIHGILICIFFEQINSVEFCGILPDKIYSSRNDGTSKYYSWIYKGPVAVILVANTICFIFILFIVIRSVFNRIRPDSNLKKFGTTVRSALAIYPLLGISYILFLNAEKMSILEFSSIINGIMGLVLFLFHIILDNQVRIAFVKQVFSRDLKAKFLCNTTTVFKEQPNSRFRFNSKTPLKSSNENSPVFESPFTIFNIKKVGKRTSKFVHLQPFEPYLITSGESDSPTLSARKSSFIDEQKFNRIEESSNSEISYLQIDGNVRGINDEDNNPREYYSKSCVSQLNAMFFPHIDKDINLENQGFKYKEMELTTTENFHKCSEVPRS